MRRSSSASTYPQKREPVRRLSAFFAWRDVVLSQRLKAQDFFQKGRCMEPTPRFVLCANHMAATHAEVRFKLPRIYGIAPKCQYPSSGINQILTSELNSCRKIKKRKMKPPVGHETAAWEEAAIVSVINISEGV